MDQATPMDVVAADIIPPQPNSVTDGASHVSLAMSHRDNVRTSLDENDIEFIRRRQEYLHDFPGATETELSRLYINTELLLHGCGHQIALEKLKIQPEPFSRGTYPVFRASLKLGTASSQTTVVKKIWCGTIDHFNYAVSEARVSFHLTKLWHKKTASKLYAPLVHYVGCCYDGQTQIFHLVFKYVTGSVLGSAHVSRASAEMRHNWLFQLASALYRLHSQHVFHCDITDSPSGRSATQRSSSRRPLGSDNGGNGIPGASPNINVMITDDQQLKLIDLGDAQIPLTLAEARDYLRQDLHGFVLVLHKLFGEQPHANEPDAVSHVRSHIATILIDELNFNALVFGVFSAICFHLKPPSSEELLRGEFQLELSPVDAEWAANLYARLQDLCRQDTEPGQSITLRAATSSQRRCAHVMCEALSAQLKMIIKHHSVNDAGERVLNIWCPRVDEQ